MKILAWKHTLFRPGCGCSGALTAFTTFTLFVLFLLFGGICPAVAAPARETAVLTDLPSHWARVQITRLVSLDVVKGYPDNTFKPDRPISQLETTALLLRFCGFEQVAERLGTGSSTGRRGGEPATAWPRAPWGQEYLDLAGLKGFLSSGDLSGFDYAAPATRLWTAKLLARVLYLLPPAAEAGAALSEPALPVRSGYAADKIYADENLVQTPDLDGIRAVSAAGVMSGYPDGTFRPEVPLTRAEMAVILSRLIDRGWVDAGAGRCLTGWISGMEASKGGRELEITTPDKAQKFKLAGEVYCYYGGRECSVEQAAGCLGEIVLDNSRQVLWLNLLQRKMGGQNPVKLRGTVKTVITGKNNLLVICDSNFVERILPLAWDAVLAGGKSARGFTSLKPGAFVDLEVDLNQIKKVTVLEVKSISGQVESISGGRLYLKGGLSGGKPGWFNNYDFARIVGKDGIEKGALLTGDRVQITYIDPYPGEIDDEIALEIRITK